jgi:hypothetical protein
MEEHRFASLLNGQPAKCRRVHTRGTEQLGCRAEII